MISTGDGQYYAGDIRLLCGKARRGNSGGDFELNANYVDLNADKAIRMNGDVQVVALQGLADTDFVIAGGNGAPVNPSSGMPANPGKDLVLKGGTGGSIYGHKEGADGIVVVQSIVDMQDNELVNVRIAPRGGLLMGEFSSE